MSLVNLEVSIPKQKMNEFIWVLTGRNKIGKTTLANKYPKPYHFKFEPSTSGLLTHETDIIEKANELNAHPWLIFKKLIDEFIQNKGYGFQTVIVDPYGVAYDQCQDYVCKKHGITHPSQLDYGEGWGYVKTEFANVTRKLLSNNFGVVIIAHIKVKNEKNGIGGEKDIIDLDIGGSSGDFIKNIADIFLLADFDNEGNRKLFVRPTTNQEAGGRLDFGVDTINLDFDELKEAFNSAIEKNNKKQGVTEEMIKNYYQKQEEKEVKKSLIKILKTEKVSPEDNKAILQQLFKKESIAELNIGEQKKYLEVLSSKQYQSMINTKEDDTAQSD